MRFSEAVARYIDYEGLAYWVHPALEHGSDIPQEVAHELRQRCPGYLDTWPTLQSSGQEWHHLMLWIGDHSFQDATREGWLDAILIRVRNHPRAIRTMEFAGPLR